MPDRLSCCVPFCRRTVDRSKLAPSHNEWICEPHWKLVNRRLKARRAKLRRILKRTSDPHRAGRITATDGLLWAACKREAIERAAGI